MGAQGHVRTWPEAANQLRVLEGARGAGSGLEKKLFIKKILLHILIN